MSWLTYSLIPSSSSTNHLDPFKLSKLSACFFMFSSKLSTNQFIFCSQYFYHLVWLVWTCYSLFFIKYSAQPHYHHDVCLWVVLCIPASPSELSSTCLAAVCFLCLSSTDPLPCCCLKCRLQQALVTRCTCPHTLGRDTRARCTVVQLRLANRASFNLMWGCCFLLMWWQMRALEAVSAEVEYFTQAQLRCTSDLGYSIL